MSDPTHDSVGNKVPSVVEWFGDKRESIGEGSIVTLKQGGPSMVVLARSAREALVAWHNDTGDLFEKMLPLIALKVKSS